MGEYCHSLEMHVLQRSYYITKTPLYGPHFYVIAALKNLRLKHALNSNNVLVLLFRQSELIPTKTFIHSVAAMTYTHPRNKLFQRYLFFLLSVLFCFLSFSLSKHYAAKSIPKWASVVVVAGCQEISDTKPLKCLPLQSCSMNCNDISSPLASEVCFNYIRNTLEPLLWKGLQEQLRVWARQLVANLETPHCSSNGPVGRFAVKNNLPGERRPQ